jgi:hypothetical protein
LNNGSPVVGLVSLIKLRAAGCCLENILKLRYTLDVIYLESHGRKGNSPLFGCSVRRGPIQGDSIGFMSPIDVPLPLKNADVKQLLERLRQLPRPATRWFQI